MQRILKGAALKKYREVLVTYRHSAKELAGDEWTLGEITGLSKKDFWTRANTDTTRYDGHDYLARDKCVDSKRDLWLELEKCMWRKHRSVYQDHIYYVCKYSVKPFKVKILCYAERIRDMYDLDKYLPPPSMKGEIAKADNWTSRNQEFTADEVRLATKDGLLKYTQDELDEHPEDYHSLNFEDFCDLLSTIEVKDERKRAAAHIKKIASSREASLSDIDKSARNQRKKKARTGVLCSNKYQKRANKHHGIKSYCVIYNKLGIPERKYMLHSYKDCTVMHTNRTIKDGMGGSVGSRTDTVKQYKKSENKWKKDLKYLNNQNKMLYSIAKKSGSHREIKNIKNIRAKASKEDSNSSSDDSDSDSSLSRYSR